MKNCIELPYCENNKIDIKGIINGLVNGDINLYSKNDLDDNFEKVYLKEEIDNKLIEKYENIRLAYFMINLSKKHLNLIDTIKYEKILNDIKKDTLELKNLKTYIMAISESEISETSDEMLTYELVQTIRDLK